MQVSCSCPLESASPDLEERLKTIGIEPIVTNTLIRAVYEGPDRGKGQAIVEEFAREANHEITVDYSEAEQRKSARRAMRKAERAAWNQRLHGY